MNYKGGRPICPDCGIQLVSYYAKHCKKCAAKYYKHLTIPNLINKKGSENPAWKGSMVGYRGLHKWIQNQLGKADRCMKNLSHKASRYHWANRSRTYKRDFNDWISLCPPCHILADKRGLVL